MPNQTVRPTLKDVARQASESEDGFLLVDKHTQEDWTVVRPPPSLKRLQDFSTSKLYPLEDMRDSTWKMSKEPNHPLRHFGGRQQSPETGE